jgi:hypothetical protein
MRKILIAAVAAAALAACANEGMREAAVRQCESVGITQKDPQFDLCTRSYTLQANQGNLETSYRRALNPTYDSGKIAHQWYGY